MLSVVAASAKKRLSATRNAAGQNMLNGIGASAHRCLRPCPTSNVPEETFHDRGCTVCAKTSLSGWVPHVRNRPVNKVFSRVRYFFGLRHRSVVGLRERTPSKSFFG